MAVDVLEGLLEEDDEVVQVSDRMCSSFLCQLGFLIWLKMNCDFVFLACLSLAQLNTYESKPTSQTWSGVVLIESWL